MNKLSDTKIYNESIKVIVGDVPTLLNKIKMEDYAIPFEFIRNKIEIFNDYRYPIAKKVYQAAKAGDLISVILADPISNSAKPYHNFPNSLMTLAKIDPIQKKPMFYVNTSLKAKFKRNKLDKTAEGVSIEPAYLYAYFQILLMYKDIKLNDAKYTHSKNFNHSIAECYGILLAKVIDQKLSISADREDFNILLFLCICFYYEALVGLPKEKALEKSKQYKFLYKDILDLKCKYLRSSSMNMQKTEEDIAKNIYPIDKFLMVIKEQFIGIENKINYRELLLWYTSMYSQNAITAIEDSYSFIQMLQLVNLKMNIYKDLLIESSIKNQMKDFGKNLANLILE